MLPYPWKKKTSCPFHILNTQRIFTVTYNIVFRSFIVLNLKCKKNPKMIILNYSKYTLWMVGNNFLCLDKNCQIHEHGWNLNMVDIFVFFNTEYFVKVPWFSVLYITVYCTEFFLTLHFNQFSTASLVLQNTPRSVL